jgi:hypothetical protein
MADPSNTTGNNLVIQVVIDDKIMLLVETIRSIQF